MLVYEYVFEACLCTQIVDTPNKYSRLALFTARRYRQRGQDAAGVFYTNDIKASILPARPRNTQFRL